jgi:hypothetical protein
VFFVLDEYVIFAVPEGGNRLRVGASPANKSPLPFGAEIITRVVKPDLNIMLPWLRRRVKRGWSAEKMRLACEAS